MRRLLGVALACALVAAGCGDDPADKTSRVDRGTPTFSNATAITNPLFPVSEVTQAIHLGEEAGQPLRIEVTLLPQTKAIEWRGQTVDTVVSQFVGYLDGEILEVALDYFAQADDGSVWYFGEDVDNYEDGALADHEGTWLAGKDGPPGMIMPAAPKRGDVYRPENIPDVVFEEVTVQAVGVTVDGPRGSIEGAVRVREHLMEGTDEEKVFAPGYGEFRAETEDELVTVAVAVPTDAGRREPMPAGLEALAAASASPSDLGAVWNSAKAASHPPLLVQQMDDALEALGRASDAASWERAAIAVAHAALDLQLPYKPPAEVDQARIALWERQLVLDRAAGNQAATASDTAILQALRHRV